MQIIEQHQQEKLVGVLVYIVRYSIWRKYFVMSRDEKLRWANIIAKVVLTIILVILTIVLMGKGF